MQEVILLGQPKLLHDPTSSELLLDVLYAAVHGGYDSVMLFSSARSPHNALVLHLPEISPGIVERVKRIIEEHEKPPADE